MVTDFETSSAGAASVNAAGIVRPAGDADIDALLSGFVWNARNLTYTFPKFGSFYPIDYSDEPDANFGRLNDTQISAVEGILKQIASYCNLTFTLVPSSSGAAGVDLAFGVSDVPETAFAYYPDNVPAGGDVWFGRQYDYSHPERGNYAYFTTIHEIGHALGLKHGHEAPDALPATHDSMEFSLMTYHSYIGHDEQGATNAPDSFPQTMMMYDIAALQYMYGANYGTNSGETVYTFSASTAEMSVNGVGQGAPVEGLANTLFLTLWDGGGTDTYDFSGYHTDQLIDLAPGRWSLVSAAQQATLGFGELARGNVFNAVLHDGDIRSLIENAIGGSGNDQFYGNQVANSLTGGLGDDVFHESSGADMLTGDDGHDEVVYAGLRADYAVQRGTSGTVAVTKTGGAEDTLTGIEQIRFSDNGCYVYDLDGPNADAAYKLYGGAFDRTPDYDGLKFWTEIWLDGGRTLHAAADFFLNSQEFLTRYGSQLSDGQFVDALYLNVLDRAGESSGRTFWTAYLETHSGDRADVLTNFTQLAEYTESLKPDMLNGYWVYD